MKKGGRRRRKRKKPDKRFHFLSLQISFFLLFLFSVVFFREMSRIDLCFVCIFFFVVRNFGWNCYDMLMQGFFSFGECLV